MTFLSFERSLARFLARLTSFLNAVVLLTDLTGRDHDRGSSWKHSASRLCPFGWPEELWRSARWEESPQRGVRGGAGFGERGAGWHPKRSFPMRKGFVPPGFLQWG
jgi:hypothetical protein